MPLPPPSPPAAPGPRPARALYEPRMPSTTDPGAEKQPLTSASYRNRKPSTPSIPRLLCLGIGKADFPAIASRSSGMADSWEDLEEEQLEVQPRASAPRSTARTLQDLGVGAGEEGWEVQRPPPPQQQPMASMASGKSGSGPRQTVDDKPLLLVDLTALSDGALHNRFDKAGCNDADLKRYRRHLANLGLFFPPSGYP